MQVTVRLGPPATGHRPQEDPYPPIMYRFRQASVDQTVWSILLPDLRDREGIVPSSSSFSFRRPGVETSGNLSVRGSLAREAFPIKISQKGSTWGSSDSGVLLQEERFGFSPFPKEVSPRPRYPITQHLSCDHPSRPSSFDRKEGDRPSDPVLLINNGSRPRQRRPRQDR